MRRASRGRLLVPGSERDVGGKAGFIGAVLGTPLDCCDGCAVGCEGCGWDWVGGLSVGALAVAGGVEMPFCMGSAAGDAMVGGVVGARDVGR